MTKWLEASKRSGTPDKTDNWDKTLCFVQEREVLSVLSQKSRVPSAEIEPNERADDILNHLRAVSTEQDVDRVLIEHAEAIKAISEEVDLMVSVRATHIHNLAQYKKEQFR